MDDVDRFREFSFRVEALANTTLARSKQLGSSFEIAWREDSTATFRTSDPRSDAFRAYLMEFRPVYSDREPVYLPRVRTRLWERLDDGELKDHVEAIQARYKRALAGGFMDLKVDDQRLKGESTLDLVMNSMFHHDVDKRRRLDEMHVIPRMMTDYLMVDTVVEVSRCAFHLRWAIEVALRENRLRPEA